MLPNGISINMTTENKYFECIFLISIDECIHMYSMVINKDDNELLQLKILVETNNKGLLLFDVRFQFGLGL